VDAVKAQAAAPRALYAPAAHARQAAGEGAPAAAENVPALQGVHALAPAAA
jgi:hypothetical protein